MRDGLARRGRPKSLMVGAESGNSAGDAGKGMLAGDCASLEERIKKKEM
jgi:hypothetical protein